VLARLLQLLLRHNTDIWANECAGATTATAAKTLHRHLGE
jgi:hypothetical protein